MSPRHLLLLTMYTGPLFGCAVERRHDRWASFGGKSIAQTVEDVPAEGSSVRVHGPQISETGELIAVDQKAVWIAPEYVGQRLQYMRRIPAEGIESISVTPIDGYVVEFKSPDLDTLNEYARFPQGLPD